MVRSARRYRGRMVPPVIGGLMFRTALVAGLVAGNLLAAGCYGLRASSGGGQTKLAAPTAGRAELARHLDPADIALPPGYRARVIASGLTFPTGLAVDDRGTLYVVESGYAYGEVFTTPRLLRVEPDGRTAELARGERAHAPWNGVDFYQGSFFIAEGGQLEGGRILRVDPDGSSHVLIDHLPSVGDHHTNGPRVGPDGLVYFGQGTATNSAVVGEDNHQFGWLARHPEFCDIPGRDVRLAGVNYTTADPLRGRGQAVTGAFLPFGTPSEAGQVIPGRVPCTGAIMRVPPAGGEAELVAWGLRNPFGLAWSPEGGLYVTENSFDDRGSRPVWGTGDVLWKIEPGRWYGWPDYFAGEPLSHGDRFQPPGKRRPQRLLAEDPGKVPKPAGVLGVHSASTGLDFSTSPAFGHVGEAFIAQFGDMAPAVGKVLAPVGFRVVRVDPRSGAVEEFAANAGDRVGPASRFGGGGLERPVAVRFSPDGRTMYIADFGIMTVTKQGPQPRPGTGVVWAITRDDAGGRRP